MKNGKDMGPQRIAASILFLWGLLYAIIEMMVVNGMGTSHISVSAVGWISRLCSLGTIVMLFRGKRNIGFVIISGIQTLLAIRYTVVAPGINALIWLAADAVMLFLVIFAAIPSFFDRKNPFKNLEFIPAGLHLLPYILVLLTAQSRIGAMYYMNAITGSLAWWLMARALTADRVQQGAHTAGANAYSTSVRYAPQPQVQPVQPAPSFAASQDSGPGVLLVRFSIDKLNRLSGSYGFQSGKLVGQAVPPSLLEGMTISDGDSAATLRGSEYVCIVSISTVSKRSVLRERIEPLILASEDIKACGVSPLTQVVSSTNEPLVADGIVRNGKIEGSGGWCASGFMSAWKEQSETPARPDAAPGYDNPVQATMPQPQGYAVPDPQAVVPLSNKFCMRCGQQLMAEAAFCMACGAAVNVSAQPKPPQQEAVPASPVMPPVSPQGVPNAGAKRQLPPEPAPVPCAHEYKHFTCIKCGEKAPKPQLASKGIRQQNKYTYEDYTAQTAEEARYFLEQTTIAQPLYYVMVHTPQGDWGGDKDGIFLSQLCVFQRDLSLRQCDAKTAIVPERMQDMQMAANKITDNYMLKVTCGMCGYSWVDGVGYRTKTIVRCPECARYNLADTGHIRFNDL